MFISRTQVPIQTPIATAHYLNLTSITMFQIFLNNWLDSIVKLAITQQRFHFLQLVCILFNKISLINKRKMTLLLG